MTFYKGVFEEHESKEKVWTYMYERPILSVVMSSVVQSCYNVNTSAHKGTRLSIIYVQYRPTIVRVLLTGTCDKKLGIMG